MYGLRARWDVIAKTIDDIGAYFKPNWAQNAADSTCAFGRVMTISYVQDDIHAIVRGLAIAH